MTEDEARSWLAARWDESRIARLDQLVKLVSAEQEHQNLIARSTLASIWARHIVDSAQLVKFGEKSGSIPWIDIGSGAGFPGLVAACLIDRPVILVEPRVRRAAFLSLAAGALGLSAQVTIAQKKIAAVSGKAAFLSARAVASLNDLFAQADHLSDPDTVWLLPKGRSAREEVASAQRTWHGMFHVEHSITDPDAMIVIASKVCRR